jgi:hypothetical protein
MYGMFHGMFICAMFHDMFTMLCLFHDMPVVDHKIIFFFASAEAGPMRQLVCLSPVTGGTALVYSPAGS